jgi:FkbM family methyltransferase
VRSAVASGIRRFIGKDRYFRLRTWLDGENSYLRKAKGLIHIGANAGQERKLYARFDLEVVWIEPIPTIFEQLRNNIAGFPRQRAYQYLLADDSREYELYVADNNGASSSILDFSKHRAMWPDIRYTGTIPLKSITLESFIRQEQIPLHRFDALVLDTQGSELKILKGGVGFLPNFRFIKVEVPDFEAYQGCCLVGELCSFLSLHGFREWSRHAFKHVPGIGTYFDVIFERASGSR